MTVLITEKDFDKEFKRLKKEYVRDGLFPKEEAEDYGHLLPCFRFEEVNTSSMVIELQNEFSEWGTYLFMFSVINDCFVICNYGYYDNGEKIIPYTKHRLLLINLMLKTFGFSIKNPKLMQIQIDPTIKAECITLTCDEYFRLRTMIKLRGWKIEYCYRNEDDDKWIQIW